METYLDIMSDSTWAAIPRARTTSCCSGMIPSINPMQSRLSLMQTGPPHIPSDKIGSVLLNIYGNKQINSSIRFDPATNRYCIPDAWSTWSKSLESIWGTASVYPHPWSCRTDRLQSPRARERWDSFTEIQLNYIIMKAINRKELTVPFPGRSTRFSGCSPSCKITGITSASSLMWSTAKSREGWW